MTFEPAVITLALKQRMHTLVSLGHRQALHFEQPTSRALSQASRNLNSRYIACLSCDALLRRPTLKTSEMARCPRCNAVVLTNKPQSAERTAAFMSASLCLFILVSFYPFLQMRSSGLSNEISVVDATLILWTSGYHLLAFCCLMLILMLPLLRILLTLAVGLALLHRETVSYAVRRIYGIALRMAPWSMVDVFMLGVVVSLVKVGQLAEIQVGIAFWALAAFTVFTTLGAAAMCADTLWQRARRQP